MAAETDMDFLKAALADVLEFGAQRLHQAAIAIGTITLMRCSSDIATLPSLFCACSIVYKIAKVKPWKGVAMSRASDRAYGRIKDMILQGDLPPGAQIREEQLAETCGVSRTPVRDALRRLESQAFIRRNESQRSFVAEWSLDDIADAFELRAILEGRAARRAAERIDPPALQQLRICNRRILSAVKQSPPDIQEFLEANRQFHAIILEKAASRRLSSLLTALVEQPVVWRTAHHYGREALLRSHAEHEELLAAFARRDGAWAEAVMSAHIHRAFHAYADAHQGLTTIDSVVGV